MSAGPEKCCGKCGWWAALDGRKFLGLCGHREHGGECTDRTEGEGCGDFTPANEPGPAWDA